MLDLGPSGFATASHVVMVLIFTLFIVTYRDAARNALSLSVALGVGALILERVYYVAARVLEPHGVDLWAAHPFPAILSGLVTLAVFAGLALPRWGFGSYGWILGEFLILALIWSAVAWVLV